MYWQCRPADLSVTPTSVVMASDTLSVVCVILCTVQSLHSYTIRATIEHNNGAVHEVNVSKYISGENLINVRVLTLQRLVDAETVPTLTVANFKSIERLYLSNIALERVPAFVNTSCTVMVISGNKIKSVRANAFSGPRPRDLDLSNNEIHSMADRSVNIGAHRVVLSCNELSYFSQSWFEEPGNVAKLDLAGNRIEHIPDRAFKQMIALEWLFVSYNRITSIGNEAFSSGLEILHLQFNGLTQLTPDMFADRDKLMSALYLHHNQLSYLPEALLVKLQPRFIPLFGNPWQCQCLRDIERWLRELNLTRFDIPARRGEPVCVVPVNFQNVCVPTVDGELQETYARGLSPAQGCWATPCQRCDLAEDFCLKTVH